MWAPCPGGGEDDPESQIGTGGEEADATETLADVEVQEEEDPWQSGGGTGADPWAGYGQAGGGNLTDSQDRATWWTDAQTRQFSHCELNSATPPGGHHPAEEMPWDFENPEGQAERAPERAHL